MVVLYHSDIALAEADVIVNAANGCGWMGGSRCVSELHRGVAESLNFHTGGAIEKESLIKARKNPKISAWIYGTKPGDIFVTESYGLDCKKVIHAVTMRYPGSASKYSYISEVIPKIFEYCHENGYRRIAIPALGCGTGGLHAMDTIRIIGNYARMYSCETDVTIYSGDSADKCDYVSSLSLWYGIHNEVEAKENKRKERINYDQQKS